MIVRIVVVLAAAAFAGGCGIEDPYNDRAPASAGAEREAPARAAGEAPPGSPEEALERFALTIGNWTNHDAARAYARALPLATGSAAELVRRSRAEMALAVRPGDGALRSTTRVESVLVHGTGDRRRAVLVAHSNMSGGSLGTGDPSYHVVLASLEREEAGWKVAEWSPQD